MITILVIEDEPLLQESILTLLELEGFQTIKADDGQMGLRLARETPPNLILCDVMMPELNGFEVLRLLRQDPVTATIPLIFITAKATPNDFRQGMNLGADDYLTKPFTQSDLLNAIAVRLAKQAAIAQAYTLALQEAEAKLDDYLHYDSITRLPTQLRLQEQFHQLRLTHDQPASPSLMAIATLHIDRFDRIEELLGEWEWEFLIKDIAQRLTTCIGSQDLLARLGRGEFAFILTSSVHPKAIQALCQTMLDSLMQPFRFTNQEIFLTASLGIALYPQDGQDLNTLIKKANAAMHYTQVHGGNRYAFYTVAYSRQGPNPLMLEASLRRALERDEFQVYYQPQVNLETGLIMGAEALLRWHSPERGMVPPLEFIPFAEEVGLIHPIGEWVLQTACQQLHTWQTAGFTSLQVGVNLSGKQFNQPQLGEKIVRVLQLTEVVPRNLELELTESTLLQNTSAAIATLEYLKALGIQIAIDDFGTGYASLSYLKQFPFDTLKIDRCFIRDVNCDRHNSAITTAVIQMAHNLNLRVIAEGVETEAELKFLRQQHCNAVQGYFFSPPLPVPKFEALLMAERKKTLVSSNSSED